MQRQRADGEAQRLFPGCGAPRSGATLIRGPACCLKQPGSRVCSAPFPALHAAPRPGHGRRNLFKYHLDLCPMLIYPYSCPPHMRGCEPVAPARGERVGVRGRVRAGTRRSGGAGAPHSSQACADCVNLSARALGPPAGSRLTVRSRRSCRGKRVSRCPKGPRGPAAPGGR
jgi:hypothetical protein